MGASSLLPVPPPRQQSNCFGLGVIDVDDYHATLGPVFPLLGGNPGRSAGMSPSIDASASTLQRGCPHWRSPCDGSRCTDSRGGEAKRKETREARHHAPMPASYKKYMLTLAGSKGITRLPSTSQVPRTRRTRAARQMKKKLKTKAKSTLSLYVDVFQISAVVYPLTPVGVHIVKALV